MTDTPQLLLVHHLKTLKLPAFLREYGKLARQCAAEGAGHVRYPVRLAELELIDRERRMVERRIRQARFPAVKSLDSFDFKAIPSLNKMLVELARCEYAERRENIIALGNSGTGKTHIALGLGLAACQKGLPVGFTTAAALVHELMEARDGKRLLRFRSWLNTGPIRKSGGALVCIASASNLTGLVKSASSADGLGYRTHHPAMAVSAWLLDMNTVLQISSDLMVLKKVSTTALS